MPNGTDDSLQGLRAQEGIATVGKHLVDSKIVRVHNTAGSFQALLCSELVRLHNFPRPLVAVTADETTAQALTRDLARGPLGYGDGAAEMVAGAVATASYYFLTVGAEQARGDGSQTVKLRHFLPACEAWPWPLNRFC